ncbi:MAG: hypothetical protein Q9205_003994, partial [Flavoplaca limonia]
TGMKCLPINQVAEANGSILHDWHAEIVAIRAFNHFLMQECLELATSPETTSTIIRRREAHELSAAEGLQPFAIHNDLQLHMYSSEAPCGDASMELLMEAQVDATPWPIDQLHLGRKKSPGLLRGRESFAELGIVRRKPGATLACVEHACERCFRPSGRMQPVANKQWKGGYAFHPFKVQATNHEFSFSRRSKPASSKELRTSNMAAVYNPHIKEALILGRLQGRQKLDPKGASATCSKRMWNMTLQVLAALGTPKLLQSISESSRVQEWKKSALFADRQRVKAEATAEALSGWIRNNGDDFEVEPG